MLLMDSERCSLDVLPAFLQCACNEVRFGMLALRLGWSVDRCLAFCIHNHFLHLYDFVLLGLCGIFVRGEREEWAALASLECLTMSFDRGN